MESLEPIRSEGATPGNRVEWSDAWFTEFAVWVPIVKLQILRRDRARRTVLGPQGFFLVYPAPNHQVLKSR